MSDKNCSNCVFYKTPSDSGMCGMCEYPIPEWLKIGASGGGYVSMPDYNGQDCATFKSRADVLEAETASE